MITVILSKDYLGTYTWLQLHLNWTLTLNVWLPFRLVSVGVVIIDDHPEVTTTEDPQSSANDDGFTEVVSRKQQKRLQDEEKRKKEEQTTQVWRHKANVSKLKNFQLNTVIHSMRNNLQC